MDSSNVSGNKLNVILLKMANGGARFSPIPGEFLSTFHDTPQVNLIILIT